MVGWHISVFRQAEGGSLPATPTTKQADRIAVWRSSVGGLNWLDELAAQGNAIKLGGDGYPYWYTAQAAHLISRITDQPPEARTFPVDPFVATRLCRRRGEKCWWGADCGSDLGGLIEHGWFPPSVSRVYPTERTQTARPL